MRRRLGRMLYIVAWPALWLYLRRGARTRVAVLAKGQILLVQGWFGTGRWGLPGGGLHRGEDRVAGAVREVAEETGVGTDPAQYVHLGSERRGRHGLQFYCHFFAVQLAAAPEPRPQPLEILAARWVPLEQVGTLERQQEVDRVLELLAAPR